MYTCPAAAQTSPVQNDFVSNRDCIDVKISIGFIGAFIYIQIFSGNSISGF